MKELLVKVYIPLQLLIFTLFIPPFQKPDEDIHFMRTVTVTKGVFFCDNNPQHIQLERDLISFYKDPELRLFPRSALPMIEMTRYINKILTARLTSGMMTVDITRLCDFYFLAYIPQAVGLFIATFLTSHVYIQFLAGRIAISFISYFWFVYLYRRSSVLFQAILIATFALPMTLHQVSAYSYDAVHIMLGLTIFSMIGKSLTQRNIGPHFLWIFFLLSLIFGLTKKIGYEALLLLVMILPTRFFSPTKKRFIPSVLIYILLLVGLIIMGKSQYINPYRYYPDLPDSQTSRTTAVIPSSNNLADPKNQIELMYKSPLNYVKTLVHTSLSKSAFYLQGMVGIFGWLDYGLDKVSYMLYTIFLLYTTLTIKCYKPYRLETKRLVVVTGILACTYLFILTLSYLYWTTPGAKTIDGVQGRYFLVLIPYSIWVMTHFTHHLPDRLTKFNVLFRNNKYILPATYISLIYIMLSLLYTIMSRYYY